MRARPFVAAAAAVVTAAASMVAVAAPASAATFTVNSNTDQPDASPGNGVCATAGGVCTLRAAVMEANASGLTVDVISVPAMTIVLGSTLAITTPVEVIGAGARSTIMTGSPGTRLLQAASSDVVVSDVALQGATLTGGFGAAAVAQSGGDLVLRRVRVAANTATTTSGSNYGAVYSTGRLTVESSEISGNTTTMTGPGSQVYGGAVTALGPSLLVTNSTIAGNRLVASSGGTPFGGGVFSGPSTATLIQSSTITANSVSNTVNASASGGNLYVNNVVTEVRQSIIAAGGAVTAATGKCGGTAPTFLDRNLIDTTSCGGPDATRTITDPKLGPLGSYGGQTDSRAPQPDSPAVGAAPACLTPTDQRGQARPVGVACDLGAVELGADLGVTTALSNAAPAPGSDVLLTAVVANAGSDTTTGTQASVSISSGEILSATPTSGSCAPSGTTAACTLPDLPSGSTITILVATRAPQSGSVTYSASVSAQQPDPNGANNSSTAQATVPGSPPPVTPVAVACGNPITGTGKPNKLTGTAAGDRIDGKAGNDRIKGLAGADCLTGAGGNDLLVGGPGADKASGGPGTDTVKVRDGARDRVTCGGGRDTVVADRKDKVARDCEVVRR